jgi:hypothetical protein
MLQRPPTTAKSASKRGAERRARQRDGIKHDLIVRTHTARLTRALRAARRAEGRDFPEGDLTRREIESELAEVVEAFVERWIGKKPHA